MNKKYFSRNQIRSDKTLSENTDTPDEALVVCDPKTDTVKNLGEQLALLHSISQSRLRESTFVNITAPSGEKLIFDKTILNRVLKGVPTGAFSHEEVSMADETDISSSEPIIMEDHPQVEETSTLSLAQTGGINQSSPPLNVEAKEFTMVRQPGKSKTKGKKSVTDIPKPTEKDTGVKEIPQRPQSKKTPGQPKPLSQLDRYLQGPLTGLPSTSITLPAAPIETSGASPKPKKIKKPTTEIPQLGVEDDDQAFNRMVATEEAKIASTVEHRSKNYIEEVCDKVHEAAYGYGVNEILQEFGLQLEDPNLPTYVTNQLQRAACLQEITREVLTTEYHKVEQEGLENLLQERFSLTPPFQTSYLLAHLSRIDLMMKNQNLLIGKLLEKVDKQHHKIEKMIFGVHAKYNELEEKVTAGFDSIANICMSTDTTGYYPDHTTLPVESIPLPRGPKMDPPASKLSANKPSKQVKVTRRANEPLWAYSNRSGIPLEELKRREAEAQQSDEGTGSSPLHEAYTQPCATDPSESSKSSLKSLKIKPSSRVLASIKQHATSHPVAGPIKKLSPMEELTNYCKKQTISLSQRKTKLIAFIHEHELDDNLLSYMTTTYLKDIDLLLSIIKDNYDDNSNKHPSSGSESESTGRDSPVLETHKLIDRAWQQAQSGGRNQKPK